MSLNRFATRRDSSEPGILAALSKVGARYMLLNVFDVLVLFRGGLFLLECKTGKGRTTLSQDKLIALGWPLQLVRTPDDALKAIGAL